MFTFLLVVQAVIAAALVTVILMQKSEGGGLTSSGSPSGLMSARGASDFLTKATAVLATLFVGMSIALAFLAATRHTATIDTSLARPAGAAAPIAGAPPVGAANDAGGNAAAVAANVTAPAAAPADNGVPLAR